MSLPWGAREARPVCGGDINEAFRVVLADGHEAFVKTRADAASGEYGAEAAGLRWLGEAGGLRVPEVLDVGEGYLALEWIERGRLDAAGERELGRGLALTHGAGAPRFGRFAESESETESDADADGAAEADGETETGADADADVDADVDGDGDVEADITWLGSLRVSNEPTEDWPTFYAERRLRPLARLAFERKRLGHPGIAAVERTCERLGELAGPPEPAARLHGDLWSGNVLAGVDGRPWLIDPSAFGGHREVDLAMLALFGGLSRDVIESYEDVTPLADGWKDRVGLYELLPLLVHAILFGGSYGASAERTAQRYGG
jgi:fructosamine-3-kinase